MANVDVTIANTAINVATTISNITVSEDNVWVTNVSTTQSNINVSAISSNITVSQTSSVSNAEVRTKISVSNESGYGSLAYDNSPTSNGIIQYTGVSTAEIQTDARTAISNASPITYNSSTGEIGIDTTALNLETYYDAGNVSGNVSLDIDNGKTQKLTLTGNITGISIANLTAGESISLLLTQDVIGNKILDTTTYTNNWTTWDFVGDYTTLDPDINSKSFLTVIYDGTNYYASLTRFDEPLVTTVTDYVDQGNVSLNRYLRAEDYGPSQMLLSNYLDITDGTSAATVSGYANVVPNPSGFDTIGNIYDTLQPSIIVRDKVGFNIALVNDGKSTFANGALQYTTTNIVTGSLPGGQDTALWAIDNSSNVQGSIRKISSYSGPKTVSGINILQQRSNASSGGAGFTNLSLGFINHSDSSNASYHANVYNAFIVFPSGPSDLQPNFSDHPTSLTITNGGEQTGSQSTFVRTDLAPHMHFTLAGVNNDPTDRANIRVLVGTKIFDNSNQLLVAGNVGANGTVTAGYFVGDGSGLTNVTAAANLALNTTDELPEGNTNLYFTTDRANTAIGAYQGDINTAGNITAAYFTGDGSGLTNIPGHLTNADVIAYIGSNNLTVGGNILPSSNAVYTLGDSSNRWKDLYLSGTSIYLDDTAISAAGGVLAFGGANIAVAGSSSYTTDDLTEGAGNIWFTTARANSAMDAYLSGGYGITYTGGVIETANSDIRNLFSAGGDIVYDAANGIFSYSRGPGDIESVTAGDGLTGGGVSGNVTLTVGAGNGITVNADNVAVDLSVFTTTDLTEGTNLYFTTDRANTASDVWLTTKTTTDLTEGTNLYFTTDRANTAIDNYVVGSENILVNSGVISLANALANVNSIQAESLNKLSLGDGVGGFTFTEALGANQTLTDVLNMSGGYGYTRSQPSSNFNYLSATRLITYSGTTDIDAYCFTGNVVSGNATIQLTGMETYRETANATSFPLRTKPIVGSGNIATLINNIVTGMSPMYTTGPLSGIYNSVAYGDGGTEGTQTPFPAGTYITSIDTGNLTVTMNNPATSDFEFTSVLAGINISGNNSFFMNTMRDTDTEFLVGVLSEYDVYGGARSPQSVGPAKMLSTNVYAYPLSGPVAGDFTYTVGTSSDYSLDMSVDKFRTYGHYTQGKVSLISSDNTYFGIKDGLVIGANTLTTSQMFDNGQSGFGISLGYDGITPYANTFGLITAVGIGSTNSFIPRLQLGNFTDLTRQENGKDYGASELLFRTYDGNLNEPSSGWYARKNTELGKIGWTSYGGGSTPVAEPIPSAYISTSAGEDWIDGVFGGKTIMSFVANSRPDTTNASNKTIRDVFLTYENGGLYLGSNKPAGETRKPVTIGPVAENYVNVQGKGTQDNWTSETKRTWVEMNSANVTADSGSRLTVTNGGHNGGNAQPVVGDIIIELDRRTGSKARLPDWACQFITSGTYGQIAEDSDTVVIGINYLGNQPLPDATPVYFTGSSFLLGQELITWTNNSNIGYIKRGRTFANSAYYGIFTDVSLTTPLTWAALTGTSWVSRGLNTSAPQQWPGPIVEYDITPSHTAKSWSFELAESSDTLELKEDSVTGVSFSSGNITATGNVQSSAVIADTYNINNGNAFLTWNPDDNTVDLSYDATGVTLQIGQEQHLYVKNATATQINNGNVVMFAGAQGDRILIDNANVNSPGFIDDYIIGIATQDIAGSSEGYVTTFGAVRGIDTQTPGWVLGDLLYVDTTTPGALTNVEPHVSIIVAAVQKEGAGGSGILFARPTFGKARFSALHDVLLSNVSVGETITWDGNDWINTSEISPSNITLTKFNETVVSLGTLSGDIAANLNVSTGSIFQVTTGGALTISSLTNSVAGTSATIIITQGATTGTLTSTMKFAGGSKTLSTTTGDIDIISVFYDGSTYYATLSKGYV